MSTESIRPKVVFFLEGENVPASRFRVQQFQVALQSRGVDARFLTTRPSKYLTLPGWTRKILLLPQILLAGQLVWIVVQRLYQIARYVPHADTVVLQRDLLYRVNIPFLEGLIARKASNARIIFDVDDAVFLDKSGAVSPHLARKFERICRPCQLVIAGNSYLAAFFERFSKTAIVPTVIDTERFSPSSVVRTVNDAPVICWTGSQSNLGYLTFLKGVLNDLVESCPFTFLIISEQGSPIPFKAPRFPVEMRPWRKDREVEDLTDADIGIMPLPSDDWSRGKCGFKLLQYMAIGLPCIGSAVGVNVDIVANGESGFLAETPKDWSDALRSLLCDKDRRQAMGIKGRERVVERYSLARWADEWVKLVAYPSTHHK